MTNPTLAGPELAAGVTLLGEYQGSGFTEPHYLIVRADQQVLHVSRLVFIVASHIDGISSTSEIAARVSDEYGKMLTAEGVEFLVEEKLRPMGVVVTPQRPAVTDVPEPDLPAPVVPATTQVVPTRAATLRRANPLLAPRFKGTLLPARAVRILAKVLAPLYFGPIVVLAVLSLAATDAWLIASTNLSAALSSTLVNPPLLLGLIAILLVSSLFHEFGHAAACEAGGATPRNIGVAVYVIYPAFFTDVTDSYRLGRAGRVRTDLGGVYFNGLAVLVLGAIYAQTRSPAVLIAIVLVHMEALQQLMPIGRLDGYFVVADLVGVPDLFGRIRPILGSLVPGRPLHPKVAELRPAVRAVVALWVLTAGPVMAAMIALLAWNAPSITRQTVDSMRRQWLVLEAAVPTGQWATGTLAVLSLLLLPLPLLGMVWLFGGLLRRMLPAIVRALRGKGPRPQRVGASKEIAMSGSGPTLTPPPAPPDGSESVALAGAPPSAATLTAADLDRPLLPTRHPVPKRGVLRRSLYAVSGGHVNPGPGAKERFEVALRDRVRTRFEGTRRIVVLSRKGGAGKTTTTLMLGHTFATHRGDRVVALDANPDAGSLAMRVPRETSSSATDLLADRAWVDRYSQIRSYTSQDPVSRLEVVASDDDPRISLALGNQDYRNLVDTLDRHYNLILVDTGTGILEDAIKGLLEEADQLVLVMPPAMDGGRVAAMTLDWLDEHGYQTLVRRSIAVVNGVRGVGSEPLELLENHFHARCSSVLRVPWDPALEAGAHTSLGDLRPATRQAYLELAAAVAESFPTSTRTLFGDPS